jgi:hypothetical protein
MHTHTHTYIYNAQEQVEMKFSCILNLRKRDEHLMYVDGGRVITAMNI